MALHADESKLSYFLSCLTFTLEYVCINEQSCLSTLLHQGFSPLFGDRRLHPHTEYSHCPHQDPALLPQGSESGTSTGMSCPQDLSWREGQEARPICLSNGVTQHCVLFSSVWSKQLTCHMNVVIKWKDRAWKVIIDWCGYFSLWWAMLT